RAAEPTPPRRPPPLLPSDLDEPWRRADRLAAFGVPGIAADALLDIARLVQETDTRAAIEARASELYARAGELRPAIATLEGASRTASYGDALRRRAALYRARLGDLREAASAWLRAGGGAMTAGADGVEPFHPSELAAVADDARRTTITFDGPLDPAWELAGAGILRRDPLTRRLEIDARDAPKAWASLPVEWDGGPIVISVDIEVERMGFNSQLAVGLRQGDGRWPLFGRLATIGGAEIYNRVDFCESQSIASERDVPLSRPRRLRMTLAYSPIGGRQGCFFADERAMSERLRDIKELPSGPLYLDIGALANAHGQMTILGAAISQIELVGLRVGAPAADPGGASVGRRLLADGAPERAIEVLRDLDEPSATDIAFLARALAERQRFDAAIAALAPLAELDDEALFEGVAALVSTPLGPLLQPVLGDRYAALTLVANYIAIIQHPHEPTTRELLLNGLPRLGQMASDHPEFLWIELIALQRRAELLDELGEPRRALDDLGRLRALTEGRELSDQLRLSLVSAAVVEAEIRVGLGEVDAARAAVSEALARTPTPEVTLSRIAERPALLPFLEELGVVGGV
ncbi:MAG: hypothetical protein H6710_24820, partial [Myxococcales bacterium]|nr:hypothetical protein [Myxococcales bacterium]